MRHQIFFLLLFTCTTLSAQEFTQTLRGSVIDQENLHQLAGATVQLLTSSPTLGIVVDEQGQFRFDDVPVGRHQLLVTYLGYETRRLDNILLSSGKEVVLEIKMEESFTQIDEIVLTAERNRQQPLNEMAVVSAKMFSVEDTQRFAATLFDPARMAQTFAGVAGGGEDLENEIVIRGNSPRGLLWRLEGIDIPNPNHFANPAGSGGAVSMLSASTLSNSDFFTGAFPAEYGEALAGVFDLRLRTGNNQTRESSFMFGALGTEVSLEGPFRAKGQSSYLINYRYSTLAILKPFLKDFLGDVVPTYQDLSFKFNFPTQKMGTISLFGLWGDNDASSSAEPDQSQWTEAGDEESFFERSKLKVTGLRHQISLSENTYWRTVVAHTTDEYNDEATEFLPEENYRERLLTRSTFENKLWRIHTSLNTKFNAKSSLRLGGFFTHWEYILKSENNDIDTETISTFFDDKGATNRFQAYAQWKWRWQENLSLLSGLHWSALQLNNTHSFDPRLSLRWQINPKTNLNFSLGKHSQHQHPSTYLVEEITDNAQRTRPNLNLDFTKAIHYVIGINHRFTPQLLLTAELYYQDLYDVPIQAEEGKVGSLLNSSSIWDILGAGEVTNKGQGRNYGIDLTLDKQFAKGYYFLMTASLYDSSFTAQDGRRFPTQYAGRYLLNLLYGKEWKARKRNNRTWNFNVRYSLRGGNRYTEINQEQSIRDDELTFFEDRAFALQYPNYSRIDTGVRYTINKAKSTHAFMLDFQNFFNRKNIHSQVFDLDDRQTTTYYQSGLIPNFNYRITF